MIKALNIASLFLGLVAFVVGSLGVLTPEIVRKVGQRLANYILSKPKDSLFLQAAFYKTATTEYFNKNPGQSVSKCVIDFVVWLLTTLIATFIAFFLVLSLSVWGLIRAWTQQGSNPLKWGLPLAGILVCLSAVFSFIPLRPKNPPRTVDRVIQGLVRANSRFLIITTPFLWFSITIVSFVTMTLPLTWYRSLKAINSRGINWLFALIGFFLFLGSCALQLSVILMSP